jgi:hypothetical protein
MTVVKQGEDRSVDLGVVSMRMLVGADETGSAFSVAEFYGGGQGSWTVLDSHGSRWS